MNRYYYLLAQYERGIVDKQDVKDLEAYLYNNADKMDKQEAHELPEIDYSKTLDTEQYLDNEYEKAVEKGKNIDYNKIYDSFGFEVGSNYHESDEINEEVSDYLKRSAKQVIYGNYTDDVTALGTAGQVALGFTRLDFAADIRDLVYDFSHWEWTGKHIGQTLLDLVGLVPGIGVVKNLDEAAGLVKTAIKNSDEAEHVVKKVLDNVDEVMPALKRSMDSENIAPLLGNAVKSSDEAAGVGKNVAKGGNNIAEEVSDASKGTRNVSRNSNDNCPYLNPNSRPSFRKGVVETTWNKAKNSDELVRDPNTGEIIVWNLGQSRKGVWDMGHVPQQKYSDVHKKYLNGEISPKQLRDWYNDPNNYRPETPHNNRGHSFE